MLVPTLFFKLNITIIGDKLEKARAGPNPSGYSELRIRGLSTHFGISKRVYFEV